MKDDISVEVKSLPLMIDTITVPGYSGAIGISSCPGMKTLSTVDLYDDRIINDLESIRKWGATVIVTLLELRELALHGVSDLPDKALSLNLLWLHLPIRNMGLPDEMFEENWRWMGPRLQGLLRDGQRILIHCKEGIGRSGIVAARLMIESGIDHSSAIRAVRKARPGSLILNSHEEYCRSLSPIEPAVNRSSKCYVMSGPCSA